MLTLYPDTLMLFANSVVEFFIKGGPIMYPIAVVALVAVCLITERISWWVRAVRGRDARRLDEVFAALEAGDLQKSIALSAGSTDPVIRMLHHGLQHPHSSMEGALEVAAGQELRGAGLIDPGLHWAHPHRVRLLRLPGLAVGHADEI